MANKDSKVIQWENPGPEDIIWANPNDTLRWGTSLVVKEWEYAVFMRDGKLFDVFEPGRHIISTQNLPLLTRTYNFLMGYKENPFKATVIFVSKKILNGKWGISAMVRAREDIPAPAQLKAHGFYQYRIDDPIIFITQVTGGNCNITTTSVNQLLQGFFSEKITQEFSKYTYMGIYSNMEITSKKVQVNLNEQFQQRGAELLSVKINNIDTDENTKKLLRDITLINSQGGEKIRMFDTMDKMAESIGQSPDGGAYSGMMLFPQMYQSLMTNLNNSSFCPQCQSNISSGSKFCPQCGYNIQVSNNQIKPYPSQKIPTDNQGFNICPYCGKELRFPEPPNFCPFCAKRINQI